MGRGGRGGGGRAEARRERIIKGTRRDAYNNVRSKAYTCVRIIATAAAAAADARIFFLAARALAKASQFRSRRHSPSQRVSAAGV
jgi:hypothetical protein